MRQRTSEIDLDPEDMRELNRGRSIQIVVNGAAVTLYGVHGNGARPKRPGPAPGSHTGKRVDIPESKRREVAARHAAGKETTTAIAKAFGISGTTVREWAKLYKPKGKKP